MTSVEDCGCKCVLPYDGWHGLMLRKKAAQTTHVGSRRSHVVCETWLLLHTDAKLDIYIFTFYSTISIRRPNLRSAMNYEIAQVNAP